MDADRAKNYDPVLFEKTFTEFDEDHNGFLDVYEIGTLIKRVFRKPKAKLNREKAMINEANKESL